MNSRKLAYLSKLFARGPRIVPIKVWDISNEAELVSRFLHLLETAFCYPRSCISQEEYIPTESHPKRADVIMDLNNDGQKRILIEFKFKSVVKDSIHEQAKIYKENLMCMPVFYSLVYRSSNNYYIEHYDRNDNRIPWNAWPSYFPTYEQALIYCNSITNTRYSINITPLLSRIAEHLIKYRWDALYGILSSSFYYRLAHSDTAAAFELLHIFFSNSRKPASFPKNISFFYYKLLGDIFDNLFEVEMSRECYKRCISMSQELDNELKALAHYLYGINCGRRGNLDEAKKEYDIALGYDVERLIPVILSELMVVALCAVIPNNKKALRFRHGTIPFLIESRHGLQNKLVVLSEIEELRKKIIHLLKDFPGCAEAINDILHLDSQARNIDNENMKKHYKQCTTSEKTPQTVKGWACNNYGILNYDAEDFVNAAYQLSNSIEFKFAAGDLATIAYSYFNRALAYKKMKDDEHYLHDIKEAKNLAMTIGDKQLTNIINLYDNNRISI